MKVLILSCNTGQGHNTAGRAVLEELRRQGVPCEMKDVLLFADNMYRYIQAKNEVSTIIDQTPAEGGYQPTVFSDVKTFQDRLASNANGSITALQTIYVPADDLSDPAVQMIQHELDSTIVLDRAVAAQGIRPAVGYPSIPDQSINFLLNNDLLQSKEIGVELTENGVMLPNASVSGIIISHPKSKYFNIGNILDDQMESYVERRGEEAEVIRKFLSANLI